MMNEWLIQEWLHTPALGERWVVIPPVLPPGVTWPGITFFPSREDAERYVTHQTVVYAGVFA